MSQKLLRFFNLLALGCFLFPFSQFFANAETSSRRAKCVPGAAKATIQVGTASGSIKFYPLKDGRGLHVHVKIVKLPAGSYNFHVHEKKPEGTNCTLAGGHLDLNKGVFPCNKKNKANCQLGDLSGKYHPLIGGPVDERFEDQFLSLKDVINRGFVIHKGEAQIACSAIVGFRVVNGREQTC